MINLAWKNGIFYLAWSELDCDRIMFSYSANGGLNFAPRIQANIPSSGCPLRGGPSVTANENGKVFVAWQDGRYDSSVVSELLNMFGAAAEPNLIKGDLNWDGFLTGVDVVKELNAVFLGIPFPGRMVIAIDY